MRRHPVLSALLAAPCLSLCACAEEDRSLRAENLLVLELGGDHESLRQSLQTPSPKTEPEPQSNPPRSDPPRSDPPRSDPPRSDPPQPDPPQPAFHVVELAQGQTLYGLCREHLGNPSRWREVAQLNGWTEERAGRLRAGQKVKMPRR